VVAIKWLLLVGASIVYLRGSRSPLPRPLPSLCSPFKPAGGGSFEDCCSLVRLCCRHVYSNPQVVAIKWLLLVGAGSAYLRGSRSPKTTILVHMQLLGVHGYFAKNVL